MFCDDLSFDEGEPGYKALKSVLDGSVSATSDNLLIYATSNRRHLLPEYMKENLTYKHTDDGEVHPGEVIEEKISLSERFGLWISFYPFSQQEYLAIVAQWLRAFDVDEATVQRRAEAVAGVGAGARLAFGPRGLPVRARLGRARPFDRRSAAAIARHAGARWPGPCLRAPPPKQLRSARRSMWRWAC